MRYPRVCYSEIAAWRRRQPCLTSAPSFHPPLCTISYQSKNNYIQPRDIITYHLPPSDLTLFLEIEDGNVLIIKHPMRDVHRICNMVPSDLALTDKLLRW
jgi:hypothetical protein